MPYPTVLFKYIYLIGVLFRDYRIFYHIQDEKDGWQAEKGGIEEKRYEAESIDDISRETTDEFGG